MNTQKFEEIEHLLEDYSMIPICKEIYADVICIYFLTYWNHAVILK